MKKLGIRIALILAAILQAALLGACAPSFQPPFWMNSIFTTPAYVLPTPVPEGTGTPEPYSTAGINGTYNGLTYKNEQAGFELTYPEGFTVLDAAQIEGLMTATKEELKKLYNDPALLEAALQQSIPVSMAMKHPLSYSGLNPNINVIVYGIPSSQSIDIVSLADSLIQTASKMFSGQMSFSEPEAVKIGGRDAAVSATTVRVNGIAVVGKQYYVMSKEYIVIITLSGTNEAELNELMQAVNSIRFYG